MSVKGKKKRTYGLQEPAELRLSQIGRRYPCRALTRLSRRWHTSFTAVVKLTADAIDQFQSLPRVIRERVQRFCTAWCNGPR